MPLSNSKVADDGTSAQAQQEGQAMVDSLTKVVACYRHLASCIGGSTDSASLRQELRQTRERAQTLALSCRDHLTARLRDKTLSEEDRRATELQWVAFSSCLELFHADMCKVYHMGSCFSVAKNSAMVQTGLQGLSTSNKAMQYDLGRSDLEKSGHKKLMFDTHAMVQLMEDSGFTDQQADIIVKMLVNTTNSNMDIMYSDMVTKTHQEIMLQKVMSHITAVKKDMIILEKSEFSALLAENERIKVELVQLKIQLSDVMNKVRLDNKLDMNLEKSQVKEMKAEHEKRLLETRNEMMEMLAEQNRHVMQNNVKIDTEVAGLKTMLESHKLDSIKYLAGSVFTCLTVVLGFFRIWM